MRNKARFKTLREFVASHPRDVRQGEIARRLGVTESALSMFLRGSRFPSREVAVRISREHGIDLEGLLSPPEEASVS